MPRHRALVPAWKQAEPDRLRAVNRRLAPALYALRDRCAPDTLASRGFRAEYIADVLTTPGNHWQRHVRRSRSGDVKFCFSPSAALRDLQKCLLTALIPRYNDTLFPGTAYGPGCSIIANATFHQRGRSSLRLDLKDAFPSVTTNQIAAMLRRPAWEVRRCDRPNCIACEALATPMDDNLAWVASRVFTHRGHLEQGAPIAPHLFNHMMERFDRDVCEAIDAPIVPTGASYSNLVYTRYADDIVVSSVDDVMPAHIEAALRNVIRAYNLRVNEYKVERTSHGLVSCPGIVIKKGRIRPNGIYVKRLLNIWLPLSREQRKGHRLYVESFGKSARLKVFRDTIPLIPRRANV